MTCPLTRMDPKGWRPWTIVPMAPLCVDRAADLKQAKHEEHPSGGWEDKMCLRPCPAARLASG